MQPVAEPILQSGLTTCGWVIALYISFAWVCWSVQTDGWLGCCSMLCVARERAVSRMLHVSGHLHPPSLPCMLPCSLSVAGPKAPHHRHREHSCTRCSGDRFRVLLLPANACCFPLPTGADRAPKMLTRQKVHCCISRGGSQGPTLCMIEAFVSRVVMLLPVSASNQRQ
jgi:hypothetical protein